MGGAFLILFFALLASAFIKGRTPDLGSFLVASLGFGCVGGATNAPMTAYFHRKSAAVPANAPGVRQAILYCFAWSVCLGTLGFVLLGCGLGSGPCLATANFVTALTVSFVVGGVLSLMVLSS
jgi:hypothetical protein